MITLHPDLHILLLLVWFYTFLYSWPLFPSSYHKITFNYPWKKVPIIFLDSQDSLGAGLCAEGLWLVEQTEFIFSLICIIFQAFEVQWKCAHTGGHFFYPNKILLGWWGRCIYLLKTPSRRHVKFFISYWDGKICQQTRKSEADKGWFKCGVGFLLVLKPGCQKIWEWNVTCGVGKNCSTAGFFSGITTAHYGLSDRFLLVKTSWKRQTKLVGSLIESVKLKSQHFNVPFNLNQRDF